MSTYLNATRDSDQPGFDTAICTLISLYIPFIFKQAKAEVEVDSPFWPYPQVRWDLHLTNSEDGPTGTVSISRQDNTNIEWAVSYCDADGDLYVQPITNPFSSPCVKAAIQTVLEEGMFAL